jgi:ornithine cyclodeaminase/alanine dehydrogenase-like protein (mu-crystallin family)
MDLDLGQIKYEVESKIDEIFVDAHQEANTKSGDITPDQQMKLDNIIDELSELIYEQVKQNL